jgi:DNA polymerase-3 subunit delta'
MELPWLSNFAQAWHDRVRHGRLPHAVLLAGPVGVGKRAAARWIVATKLGLERSALPDSRAAIPEHADLHWITIPEDKSAIGIDQVRALVHALSLTSYAGGGKAAVIEPANAMTDSAANSLLKTLEEPPGDALLILVVDRVGRLPATIFSRCQRIDFATPPEDVVLAWLDRQQPGAAWAEALRVAGGAPLLAPQALEDLETGAGLARDLNALGRGSGSAVAVAKRWAGLAPEFVLDWLAQQLKLALVAASAGRERAAGLAIDESVLRRMDSRNMFCYLDIINRLRGQPRGSFNVQLTLEGLLIDWADGLRECTATAPIDGMNQMLAGARARQG